MSQNLVFVPITSINPNPYQPASARDEQKVLDIAQSLVENVQAGIGTTGLNQVPTARKCGDFYQLAFGHHRWLAFSHLYEQENRSLFLNMPLILEDLNDQQMFEAMATENLQRREISFIEEAEMFHAYMTLFNKTSVETAQRYQKTEEHVRGRLMFLQLPDAAKEKAKAGEINVTTARNLVSVGKVGGEKAVNQVLQVMKKHDATPGDAVRRVLQGSDEWTWLDGTANWATANKNFPRKHLPALKHEQVVDILEAKSPAENASVRELLQLIEAGNEFKDDQFPAFKPELLDRLRTLIKPGACTSCPFHTTVDNGHYCGIKLCRDRKQEAWKQKELEDVAVKLGIPMYQRSEGKFLELNKWNETDRKLFADGHPDLRLVPSQYLYNNFEGVGTNLKVVMVGDLYEKRAKTVDKQAEKEAAEKQDRARKEKIDHLIEQYELRFGWEVASFAFLPLAEGLPVPFVDCLITDTFEYALEDTEMPEGCDDWNEQIGAARKLKKVDAARQIRRLFVYGLLFRDALQKFSQDQKNRIVILAKELQELASKWEVKLGATFMKQAEKYQAELDAAIKEINKPAQAEKKAKK